MTTFWKGVPRVVEKQERADAFERDLADAYGMVDIADGNRCYITGLKLFKAHADPWQIKTHHHLEGRAHSKRRRTDPSNIILLSLGVHRLVTAGVLFVLTSQGEKALNRREIHHVEWNRSRVPEGREPVRIKPALLAARVARRRR